MFSCCCVTGVSGCLASAAGGAAAEPCPDNRYLLQAGLPKQVAEAVVNPGAMLGSDAILLFMHPWAAINTCLLCSIHVYR
jgi:hypothetical protein